MLNSESLSEELGVCINPVKLEDFLEGLSEADSLHSAR